MESLRSNSYSKAYTVFLIPLSIYILKMLEVIFPIINKLLVNYGFQTLHDIEFVSTNTTSLIYVFMIVVGIIYGFLLPSTLIKVWEQLHKIDQEFDREADTVKILYQDILLLQSKNAVFKNNIAALLHDYVLHVIQNYHGEIKSSEKSMIGDLILERIRQQYKPLFYSNEGKMAESEPLIAELIHRLNDIVDIRGDRIALSSQRLFESLRIVVLITSILFLLPFYFVGFTPVTGVLGNILIISITLLVIFIYIIIEDLDEPFAGNWRIGGESWRRTLDYMKSENDDKYIIGDTNNKKKTPPSVQTGKIGNK